MTLVMVLYSTVIKKKIWEKNLFFVRILKATDEKSRIQIRTRKSVERIFGSGSVPKCHGSATQSKQNELNWSKKDVSGSFLPGQKICTKLFRTFISRIFLKLFCTDIFRKQQLNDNRGLFLKIFILYLIQHCFICRLEILLCRRMLDWTQYC